MKYKNRLPLRTCFIAFTIGLIVTMWSEGRAESVDIALVIDSSGSMSAPLCDSTKMFWAKEASKLYVELTDLDDAMAVIPFSTTADVTFPMTNADLINKPWLKSAIIEPITPDGWSTDIGGALQTAKDEIDAFTDPKENHALILLTDGLHNGSINPCDVDLAGSDIQLFLTTFGYEHSFSTDFLQCQLDATDGIWYHADCDNLDDFDFPSVHYWNYYLETHNMVAFKQSKKKLYRNQTTYEKCTIDEFTKKVNFAVHWGSGRLSLYLISPSGKVITEKAAAYNTSIRHSSSKTWSFFELLDPEPGQWGMVIKRMSWGRCTRNKYYVAQVGGMNHNLSFSIATDKLIYKHDDKIVIKSELMADKSITNSKITCNVSLSNKFNEQFFLYDDGKHGDDKPEDGIYGNCFYTKQFDCQGGPYEISISAVNNDTKLSQYFDLKYPFQRMKQKTVYVEPENPPMFIFGKIVRIGNTTIIVRDKSGNMHSVRLTDKQDLERIFIGCRVNLAVQNYQDYTSGKLLDWELRK